jgi:hypothetical protein
MEDGPWLKRETERENIKMKNIGLSTILLLIKWYKKLKRIS